jgi:hypothetical protein
MDEVYDTQQESPGTRLIIELFIIILIIFSIKLIKFASLGGKAR